MKIHIMAALALGSVLFAAPSHAFAADGGSVCGRVNAPSSLIVSLAKQQTPENVIIARSSSEEVKTTVNLDGTYCFTNLHNDLHIVNAFDDGFSQYTASVLPETGKTIELDISAPGV